MPADKNVMNIPLEEAELTEFPIELSICKWNFGHGIKIYDKYFLQYAEQNLCAPEKQRYRNQIGEYFDVTLAQVKEILNGEK